jgi:hypothetical protein
MAVFDRRSKLSGDGSDHDPRLSPSSYRHNRGAREFKPQRATI